MPCTTFPAIVKSSLASHAFCLVIDVLPLNAFDPAAFDEVKIIAYATSIVHVEDTIRMLKGVLHFTA